MTRTGPVKAFLSYSSRDADLALRLAKDLRASGVDIWLDQWKLNVGEPIVQTIEQGLDDAEFVIVLLTHASVDSTWVQREWSRKVQHEGQARRVSVIPVRGERCDIPDFLAQRSYADVSGGSYRMGLSRLLQILRHHAADASIHLPDVAIADADPQSPTLPIVVPIGVEVSHDLIPLFETRPDSINRMFDELLPQMRSELAEEIGFPFPGVQVRGNERDLPPGTLMILIDEVPEVILRVGAEDDAAVCIVRELHAVLRQFAALFLDLDTTRRLVADVESTNPELVAGVVPDAISWMMLTDVLRRLVTERICIGDLSSILAAFSADVRGCDAVELAERARHALSAQITARFATERGDVAVLLLAREIEAELHKAIRKTSAGIYLALEPEATQQILAAIRHVVRAGDESLDGVPILTDRQVRPFVRRLVELEFPMLEVLSRDDLQSHVHVHPLREIAFREPSAADQEQL